MDETNAEEQIRYIILNENENKSDELYRLKKGWIFQLKLSSGLFWKKVRIFINHPLNEPDEFERNKYVELKWTYPSSGKFDNSDRYVFFQCYKAGTFHYYFTIDGTTLKENANGQGYFQVEPKIEKLINQESIACQSVLSKSLGPISERLSRLEVARHSGYNMIHFTPIQLLYHVSNSSYAVTDHHKLNPLFKGTHEQMKEVIDQMAKEWNIYSVTDLVYNHAANDCALFRDHPEAAYNLINSPHLKPAVLLDSILMQFTRDANEGKLKSRGIPSEIKEHHLQLIRHYLFNEQFQSYKFYEFYIVDTNELVKEFHQQLSSKSTQCPQRSKYSNDYQLEIQHGKYNRMKSRVDLQLAEEIYYYQRDYLHSREEQINAACDALRDRIHFF
jgi:glycogen debranching enzyme